MAESPACACYASLNENIRWFSLSIERKEDSTTHSPHGIAIDAASLSQARSSSKKRYAPMDVAWPIMVASSITRSYQRSSSSIECIAA